MEQQSTGNYGWDLVIIGIRSVWITDFKSDPWEWSQSLRSGCSFMSTQRVIFDTVEKIWMSDKNKTSKRTQLFPKPEVLRRSRLLTKGENLHKYKYNYSFDGGCQYRGTIVSWQISWSTFSPIEKNKTNCADSVAKCNVKVPLDTKKLTRAFRFGRINNNALSQLV